MKKIFFLSILFISSVAVKSQDIIIRKSGDEIKAKVLEIGTTEIKYKRYDFQDGPVYTIFKADVVLVRYENGINEVITTGSDNSNTNSNNNNNNNNSTTPPSNTTTQPGGYQPMLTNPAEENSGKINYVFGSYSQNGKYLSKNRLIKLLAETKDAEINRLLRKSRHKKNAGNIIALSVGLPLIIIGSITTLSGVVITLDDMNYNPDGPGIITAGAVMAGAGVMIQLANIGFQSGSRKALTNAIAIYNKKYVNRY